ERAAMLWTIDDELRFADDLLDFLDANLDADDLAEKTVGLIEDQLLIAGVAVPECGVHISLLALFDRIDIPRVRRLADSLSIRRCAILASLIAGMTAGIINRDDVKCRTRSYPLEQS